MISSTFLQTINRKNLLANFTQVSQNPPSPAMVTQRTPEHCWGMHLEKTGKRRELLQTTQTDLFAVSGAQCPKGAELRGFCRGTSCDFLWLGEGFSSPPQSSGNAFGAQSQKSQLLQWLQHQVRKGAPLSNWWRGPELAQNLKLRQRHGFKSQFDYWSHRGAWDKVSSSRPQFPHL